MKPICIIPARKGSKRIKNKNIKLFAGKPLISYAIKIAKKSKLFSRIIVSTDSKKIANIAKNNGAEVPFIRSKKLSNDFTGTNEVLIDCIYQIRSIDIKYHFCIYPTAPLIESTDLIKAFKIIKSKGFDHLVAMSNYNVSPFVACQKISNSRVKFYWPKFAEKRSQDMPNLLHDTGTFYIHKTKALVKAKGRMPKKTTHYMLDKLKSVDINTMEDFKLAEHLYKYSK